ncbi:hypothetical protein EW145_g3790 [Phellinidium pouzarii]|uniref:Uncharacterized protein n=1 Tax=Phellinidium pouzarii TaxID=167371 RepID=A0A4S4L7B3_9AGAM|nr:hypothetical protein EW145_g3790 [Phellinidium pouzarii]
MPVSTTEGTPITSSNAALSAPLSTISAPPTSSDTNGPNNAKKWRARRKPERRQGESSVKNQSHDRGVLSNVSEPRSNVKWRDGGQRRMQGGQSRNNITSVSADTVDSEVSGRSTPFSSGSRSARGGRTAGDRGDHGKREQPLAATGPSRGGGRRKNMNVKLTGGPSEVENHSATPPPVRRREAKADNLTNRLIESLRTPPYADCPICFNPIHPAQPIWSCSPTLRRDLPPNNDSEYQAEDAQCCYTPFHLKCIKEWASKSVKDMRDAFHARGVFVARLPIHVLPALRLRIAVGTLVLALVLAIMPAHSLATLVHVLRAKLQHGFPVIAGVR